MIDVSKSRLTVVHAIFRLLAFHLSAVNEETNVFDILVPVSFCSNGHRFEKNFFAEIGNNYALKYKLKFSKIAKFYFIISQIGYPISNRCNLHFS